MGNKRLNYFDMVKGLAIILVVLGHVEYISHPLRTWISSFHMPVFFIVSGMLIRYKNEVEKPLSITVPKKVKGLLIPYFWFSLLYFFIDIFNVKMDIITPLVFVKDLIASLTFYGVSVLWFLPALLISEVVFLFLTKKLKPCFSIPIIAALAIGSYLIQLSISNVYNTYASSLLITSLIDFARVFLRGFIATAFVMIAYYAFPIINRRDSFSWLELTIGLVMFIANLVLSQINGCVDFHYIIENNVPLFYLCALLGSFSLILICKNCKHLEPIAYLGRNSLIVMATHINTYVLYCSILVSIQIDKLITHAKQYIFVFNIVAITFLCEAVIIYVINRFFPFVLGKGKFPINLKNIKGTDNE